MFHFSFNNRLFTLFAITLLGGNHMSKYAPRTCTTYHQEMSLPVPGTLSLVPGGSGRDTDARWPHPSTVTSSSFDRDDLNDMNTTASSQTFLIIS